MKHLHWRIAAVLLFLSGVALAFREARSAEELIGLAIGSAFVLIGFGFLEHHWRSR